MRFGVLDAPCIAREGCGGEVGGKGGNGEGSGEGGGGKGGGGEGGENGRCPQSLQSVPG